MYCGDIWINFKLKFALVVVFIYLSYKTERGIDCRAMTITVDLGQKATKQTKFLSETLSYHFDKNVNLKLFIKHPIWLQPSVFKIDFYLSDTLYQHYLSY